MGLSPGPTHLQPLALDAWQAEGPSLDQQRGQGLKPEQTVQLVCLTLLRRSSWDYGSAIVPLGPSGEPSHPCTLPSLLLLIILIVIPASVRVLGHLHYSLSLQNSPFHSLCCFEVLEGQTS